MVRRRLVWFVRSPSAGPVKTRLQPPLSLDEARRLYVAFCDDSSERIAKWGSTRRDVEVELWCAGEADLDVDRWARRLSAKVFTQPSGDLGTRMRVGLAGSPANTEPISEGGSSLYAGPSLDGELSSRTTSITSTVLIGSDSPTLPMVLLDEAFDALQSKESPARPTWVLGPASDGGYYLIGACRFSPRFDSVTWSTDVTLQQTIACNDALAPTLLSPWYDVDDVDDLQTLDAHLWVDPNAAPRTRQVLHALNVLCSSD